LSLCLASAGVVKALAVTAFTLSWVHSVEKIEWQEDWRVTSQGLQIVQARVKGSGAGMEPPPDARLVDGFFRWKPQRPALPEVVLGNSGLAGEWRICTDGKCQDLSLILGRSVGTGTTTMSVCNDGNAAVPPALDARALTARGEGFNAKGDIDRAIADYDAALKIDPGSVEALNSRAMAWRAKGDRRRALADLDAALRLKPDFEVARANRKVLFQEIERAGAHMPLKPPAQK
jgi:tetratricopeptide (TPR) repeat protein